MKYTKAQRHKIYVRALKSLPGQCFLCSALSTTEYLADLNDFKEVLKQEPKLWFNDRFWFDIDEVGMKKRAAILRKAIKATE